MNDYSSFIKVIKDFIQLFEAMIPLEQKKLDSVVNQKISVVEDCMNQEQAAILRLKGLEIKRQKIQKELGVEDLTFRQILEKVSPEIKDNLQPLFDELTEKIHTFQSINASAKDAIEVNLHVVQSALASGSTNNTYSSSGSKTKKTNKHFTSRSV